MGFLLYFCDVKHTLVVLVGPTGVGKTELSLRLAEQLRCSIISADSRQFFRQMDIGTAAPTLSQLERVPHYFVRNKNIEEYYSAGKFELEVLGLLPTLFRQNPVQVMVGGSMLYVDAVCNGLDDIPKPSDEARATTDAIFKSKGQQGLVDKLKEMDPVYASKVALLNKQRVQHAIEISLTQGSPYSELLNKRDKTRPFYMLKLGLTMEREQLYQRINDRVDAMMAAGLLDEAKKLYSFKTLNALNTVGYKELFNYFDGTWTLDFAVNMIKQDTRRYAKRQMTWFRRDEDIHWFQFGEQDSMLNFVSDYFKKEND